MQHSLHGQMLTPAPLLDCSDLRRLPVALIFALLLLIPLYGLILVIVIVFKHPTIIFASLKAVNYYCIAH